MKRIVIGRGRNHDAENDKKVDAVMQELKETLDVVNEKTDEVIDNVVAPVTKFIVNDVVPVIETVVDLLDSEAPSDEIKEKKIITKQTIKINEPVDVPDESINDIVDEPNEQLCDEEINTIELDEPILPFEECLLKIEPVANREISHIISANIIMSSQSYDINHEIIQNKDDPKSFLIHVKNNGCNELNIKICYCVKF